ncbi:hypothetical protein WN51_00773 [Melipona quadrifasciata]|uniref:FAS1 domain-containing protein n=1 Tax=Melipona quadrifasciata TaxID=166423 RepID=A0A0M8ZZK3_9HYME|nr:hypothetical protein WN51_00773 [Melipona quadrifasciata]
MQIILSQNVFHHLMWLISSLRKSKNYKFLYCGRNCQAITKDEKNVQESKLHFFKRDDKSMNFQDAQSNNKWLGDYTFTKIERRLRKAFTKSIVSRGTILTGTEDPLAKKLPRSVFRLVQLNLFPDLSDSHEQTNVHEAMFHHVPEFARIVTSRGLRKPNTQLISVFVTHIPRFKSNGDLKYNLRSAYSLDDEIKRNFLYRYDGSIDSEQTQKKSYHSHPSHDPRPRLSASQQAQILSDVQQHQQRFRRPQEASNRGSFDQIASKPQTSASYTSLAKYKKQRQQLLLEQQELRRQQELLRLQQLQKLTSTTPSLPPVTSPSTIAVSTTASPVLVSLPTRKITPSETDLFLKAIATHQKKYSTTTPISSTTTTTARTTTTSKPTSKPTILTPVSSKAYQEKATVTSAIPENLLSLIQEQQNQFAQQGKPKPQIKVIYQTEKPGTSRSTTPKTRSASLGSERDVLLKQLKIALAQSVDDDIRNVSTRDIVLPNGKKIQFIDSSSSLTSNIPADGSILTTSTLALTTSTTTIKPPKAILEELTKGVLPPGADFEVIRQKSDGKLEEIGKAPIQSLPAKKVTFVVLEEQPDGSYKVQGVKGNTEKEGSEVESIVEKIKKGELKLPPSSSNPTTLSSLQSFPSSLDPNSLSTRQGITSTTSRSTAPRSTSISSRYTESKPTEYFPHVTVSPNSVSTTDKYLSSASSVTSHVFNSLGPVNTTPKLTSPDQDNRAISKYPSVTRNHFIPTMAPVNEIITTTPASVPTTFSQHSTNSYTYFTDSFERSTISPTIEPSSTRSQTHESLITLLRREGLFAMAKYLRQSGLDNVLNETALASQCAESFNSLSYARNYESNNFSLRQLIDNHHSNYKSPRSHSVNGVEENSPYTIFVPTDKAFRTLLVQLGGPEKAEQKFRDNPRLLSGLLLHHVIPGAFRIDSLQDEMTGVSLAGTQLRVNEYAMHDHEWNDIKVTTINGAKVASTKRDIEIPQGIAHAIDRVMFPLPVGDLVQTLQADRERRFTTFLKMLYTSGLQDTLAGKIEQINEKNKFMLMKTGVQNKVKSC